MNLQELRKIREAALAEADAAADAGALEAVRIKYLGRNGLLPEIMAQLKHVPNEEKPAFGKEANAFKQELGARIKERQAQAESGAGKSGPFDPTLPGQWPAAGSEHPISSVTARIVEIFQSMGFTVADGPDIETVWNNFDALNTPDDHPSRDEQDTFYLENGDLLRCHTSPVQVRYMEMHQPPIRIVAPGRCYRRDTPDATHSANFHQVEGLYVAEKVSMADLKGTLAFFARQFLGDDVQIRFRPHFFPFTEPSFEVDFFFEVGGKSRWIEVLGAGMVDPEVFRKVGYDPDKVTGFAFGMGIERLAMILYGIKDIRLLYENDVRFLSQFAD